MRADLRKASCRFGGFFMSEYGNVFTTLEENVNYLNTILPVRESFDIIQRDIIIRL